MKVLQNQVLRRYPGASYSSGTSGRKDVPEWVLLNEFDSSYYSGLDISIYFDAVFVDEIVSVQYQELEQVKPNFSYADWTMRGISRGTRLVSGSFSVNFKEASYMKTLLAIIRDESCMEDKLQRLSGVDPSQILPENSGTLLDRSLNRAINSLSAQETRSIVQMALAGDFTLEDFVNIARSGADGGAYSPSARPRPGDEKFGEFMDSLDAAIWGPGATFSEPGIITKSSAEILRESVPDGPKWNGPEKGFDITVKYGQPEDKGEQKAGWGTLKLIKNCHITGVSEATDDSGRNNIENYTFIASTIV